MRKKGKGGECISLDNLGFCGKSETKLRQARQTKRTKNLQDDVRAKSDEKVRFMLQLLFTRVPIEEKGTASEQPPDLTVTQAQVWNARNQLNELQKLINLRKREGWVEPQ